MSTLYKVLKDGKSCHGGEFRWSLPKPDGAPGDWHEVQGKISLCHNGFHLTDTPDRWHVDDCDVYEVEAEGVTGEPSKDDRKVVARRVRLVRLMGLPSWVFSGDGSGSGYGYGDGYGYGYGYGYGSGSGYGSGYGDGYGYGSGYGWGPKS